MRGIWGGKSGIGQHSLDSTAYHPVFALMQYHRGWEMKRIDPIGYLSTMSPVSSQLQQPEIEVLSSSAAIRGWMEPCRLLQ